MRSVMILILMGLVLSSSFAQKRIKGNNSDEVLAMVVKGFEGVHDFSAMIDAEINMERMQIPKMHADIFFKKPDKVHFSSKGFLFVPREGFALNPAVLQEHYLTTSVVEDTVEGKQWFKLLLTAKDSKTRLRTLFVWVDPLHWTIAKIETMPYEGRTLSILFTYEYQQDKFWLPSKMVVRFGSESDKTQKDSSTSIDNQLDALQRNIPRSGTVTVVYSNYKINIGLPDELFEKKEK